MEGMKFVDAEICVDMPLYMSFHKNDFFPFQWTIHMLYEGVIHLKTRKSCP